VKLWTVYSGNLAVFTVLCEQYQLALQRDPTYADVSCRQWIESKVEAVNAVFYDTVMYMFMPSDMPVDTALQEIL